MEEETNNTSQSKDILSQNLVSKNEATSQLQKQKTNQQIIMKKLLHIQIK